LFTSYSLHDTLMDPWHEYVYKYVCVFVSMYVCMYVIQSFHTMITCCRIDTDAVSRFSGKLTFVPICTLKTYGTVKLYFYTFLTSAPDGEEWSASRSGSFPPRKEPRRTL
jgi:hypothetical protein